MSLCQCGCGETTPTATRTRPDLGTVQGRPIRFLQGHSRRRALAERFWEKVDKTPGHGPNGDCWLWTAATDKNDYGIVNDGNRGSALAHRVAYELTHGPLGERKACHRCDNPPCVRPDHVFPGTQADNLADCAEKGRVRNQHEPVTSDQRAQIRQLANAGVRNHTEIAARVGVSHDTVSRALRARERLA